jgi:PqqA peptide cyclase
MSDAVSNPLALVAELTHRCPLHCVYCSNPLELQSRANELSTEVWSRIFKEAAEAGVLQADFTGGEPLARPDIVDLVRNVRTAGLYVSLITSGLPLDEVKLDLLVDAGLDHFQLSFQGAREETANDISGTKSHRHKLRVLQWLKRYRIGLTLNFVIHRRNIDELEEMLAIVEDSGAGCVEFASVQYYGWAFANRENLLPTWQQLDRCVEVLHRAEEQLRGKTRVLFVVPDYYARFPKPCVGGWGRKLMLITPNGDALPCHAAPVIPGLKFENVKNRSLREIWEHSEAFQKFRGEDWMQEPCKSCERRAQDFGGCRCQAMLLAGDASATDPVCSLAPQRAKVDAILAQIDDARPMGAGLAYPEQSGRASQVVMSTDKIDWLYRPNPA